MNDGPDEIFKGRIDELARTAAASGRFVFTDFLDMAQRSYILAGRRSLPALPVFYGGYPGAERVIAGFGVPEEAGYEAFFPIAIVHISPLNERFSDKLSHRDFLGAVLNLGIDRRLTGDILTDGTEGWIFVREHIAAFIEESLTQIKHTRVKAVKTDHIPDGIIREPLAENIIVPSLRLDVLISRVFNLPRKETEKLLASEKVFINGIVRTKSSYILKEGDLVSVRGCGRFRYAEDAGNTKKGNIKAVIEKYR